MKPSHLRFAAETYTWFMAGNGQTHAGRLGHMIDVTARAGFAGIEPTHFWMGDLSDPDRLADRLNAAGIELTAIALALRWNDEEETAQEKREADQTIALLKRFPGALLCTVQIPSGRHDLIERRRRLLKHVNAVSRRSHDAGVPASFHPNSPHTSIIRTPEDYEATIENLDTAVTGWTPDVGHLANGGMNPLLMMQRYASLINLVHYKDWDGVPEFCLMGRGKVDFVSITRWLISIGYSGWIVSEDESPEAIDDPDKVTLHDGRWIKEKLLPQCGLQP